MNWQLLVGTGVFVGTIVMLLYVRHRSVASGRLRRPARRVLAVLARSVGTAQSYYDIWQLANVSRRDLPTVLRDLETRELVEVSTDRLLPVLLYQLTPLGVVASQRGARGQHGRHR